MANNQQSDSDFKPYGAMTFFIGLMILSAVIWFGIYFFMINSTH